jgi:hypothetical protein
MACAGKNTGADGDLALQIHPLRDVLRPGEGVVVKAELENTSDRTVAARHLNRDSVTFWWWSEKDTTPLTRRPVASPREDLGIATELPPDSSVMRRFLLTDLSPEPGTYFLQAHYSSPTDARDSGVTAISTVAQFRVEGEPLFTRGDDGLISSADAIRIAKEYLGRPVSDETAELILNEAGFFDYWVTLTLAPETVAPGEKPRRSYFINPYMGEVRKEARAAQD